LLHTRFGTSKQAASFEATLRARLRQENESLQELHCDISRLVQLALPDQPASYLALVGRHAFLNALDDGALEYEVLKLRLKTLSDAADFAIHLESLAESVRTKPRGAMDKVSGCMPQQRNILAVSDKTEPKQENKELQQKVAELEKQLKQLPILLRSLTLGIVEDGAPLDKTAMPWLLVLINLVIRRTHASSAMS